MQKISKPGAVFYILTQTLNEALTQTLNEAAVITKLFQGREFSIFFYRIPFK